MDLATQSPSPKTSSESDKPTYFRHSRRASWGVAVLLWERDGKRAYRFSDGQERVFKDQFCALIVPVDDDVELSTEQRRALRSSTGGGTTTTRSRSGRIEVDIEDQVSMLHALYPEGFRGTDWIHRYRTEPGKRRAKRFRDPVIEFARDQLSEEAVAKCVAKGDWPALFARSSRLVGMSDLVPAKQVREFEGIPIDDASGKLLADYLTEGTPGPAFDTWINLLRRAEIGGNLWPLATLPLAALHPKQAVCVRTNVFDRQGQALVPGFHGAKLPSAADYARYLVIAEKTRDRLDEQGQAPTDLFDVADFIWETMRPAARDEINRLRADRLDL